jgi:hypothetical protein
MAFRKSRKRIEVKAAGDLTTSYVATTAVDIGSGMKGQRVGWVLTVVKGTGTTMEFVLEVGDEDAVAATAAHWSKLCKATGAIDERAITLATLAATDYVVVFSDVDLSPFQKVRLALKHTGGANVNVAAYAVVSGEI